MASLFKWLGDAANTVGQTVDNVVPGNQSFLHRPAPQPVQPQRPVSLPSIQPVANAVNAFKIPGLGNYNIGQAYHDFGQPIVNGVQNTAKILAAPDAVAIQASAGAAAKLGVPGAANIAAQAQQFNRNNIGSIPYVKDAIAANRQGQSFTNTFRPVLGGVAQDVSNAASVVPVGRAFEGGVAGAKLGIPEIAKLVQTQGVKATTGAVAKNLGKSVVQNAAENLAPSIAGGTGQALSNPNLHGSDIAKEAAMNSLVNEVLGTGVGTGAHIAGAAVGEAARGIKAVATSPYLRNEGGYIAGTSAKGLEQAAKDGKLQDPIHGNQPFYEVSDKGMDIRKSGVDALNTSHANGSSVPLSTLISHDKLNKDYPGLMDKTQVVIDRNIPRPSQFNYDTNTIHINDTNPANQTAQGLKQSIVHETQHAIDNAEGMPRGTVIESRLSKADQKIYNKLNEHYQDVSKRVQANDLMLNEKRDALIRQGMDPKQAILQINDEAMANPDRQTLDKLVQARNVVAARSVKPGANEVATNNYMNNLAEGRAHTAENRLNMSQRQIDKNPIDGSFGIAPGKVADNIGQSGLAAREETSKRAPQSLNTDRLNISDAAKSEVNALSQPEELGHMSDRDVVLLARDAGVDLRSHSLEETKSIVAAQLNLRQKIVSMTNQADQLLAEGKIGERAQLLKQIQEFATSSRKQGTDIARQLSARRIIANELDTPMQRIFKLLEKAGVNPDVAAERMANVDFNDSNAVVKAYRELVPPKAGDWLDTIRYNSMLSSPLTQINNIFPNIESTAMITPIEKTLTGILDAIHSAATGEPRQYAVGEGAAYAKGYFKSLGEARRRFSESMSGKADATNLDTKGNVPMYAHGQNKAYDVLSFPMRLMEAMDGFFTGLTEGGVNNALNYREARGITIKGGPNAKMNTADAEAAYRLYRQELGDKSQGTFLQAMDIPAQKLMELRNSKNPYVSYPAKFTVPFVRTTANIFKQGFEYSPAGVLTLHGASNKTEQLSKMILGTTVVGTAAGLLGQNRLTWAQPTNQKQKEAWLAAGMQPYSLKIGNQWVSFQKLPPALSFNLALVAALDDAQKNAKINQNGIDNVIGALSKYGQFLGDQSYTKSAGNFLKAVQGDPQAFTQLVSGYPQQLVPFRALSNWFATMTDDKMRKINTDGNFAQKQLEALMQTIPVFREMTTEAPDPNGNALPSQHPVLNAFSPVKVTTEDATNKNYYDALRQKSLDTANSKITSKQVTDNTSSATGITDPKALSRVKEVQKTFATNLPQAAANVLTDYAKLDAKGKDAFNNDPAQVYKLHFAQYQNDKGNAKLNPVEDYKKLQTLGKEKITSKYPQDVQEFYGMSKAQQAAYFATDPTKAQDLYDQAKQLDADLGNHNFATGTKYKYGLGTKPKSAKKISLKGGGSSVNKLITSRKVSIPKAPKAPKLAKVHAPKMPKVNVKSTLPKIPQVAQAPKPPVRRKSVA